MYVVGDLHGDLDQARCALEMAGVLSSDGLDLWTGGESVSKSPIVWPHQNCNSASNFFFSAFYANLGCSLKAG